MEDLQALYAFFLSTAGDDKEVLALESVAHLVPSAEVLQYVHCIPSQLAVLSGPKAEKLWSYWLNHLAEPLPTLALPTDRPRPPRQTSRGTSYTFPVPQRLHTGLAALAREEGVTMYTLLLACYYTLLHVYSGQEDLVVGSPMACRNESAREGAVGYFVNALPLRSSLAGNPSFRSYLARVKQVVLGALSHQDLPLALLTQRLLQGKDRDATRTPVFQTLFILQKPHKLPLAQQGLSMFFINQQGFQLNLGPNLQMDSVQIGAVDDDDEDKDDEAKVKEEFKTQQPTKPTIAAGSPLAAVGAVPAAATAASHSAHAGGAGGQKHSQFDLALVCSETHRELVACFNFNTDLFQLATIQRMAGHFVTLLESVVAQPSSKLSALNVLPAAEKDVLLNDWCATRAYSKEKLIHELVEQQALERPEALAVVGRAHPEHPLAHQHEEQRMSFGQLNSRANQLAHYLRFQGVNLETPVFVLMQRTPLFIVTLLACLKSGGSYVPIDPSYPKMRIEHIMEQAESKQPETFASPSPSPSPSPDDSPQPPSSSAGGSDGFALILTERSLSEKVPSLSTPGKARFRVLYIDELEDAVETFGNTTNLPLLLGQNSASCMAMVFTSGSTGKRQEHTTHTHTCA